MVLIAAARSRTRRQAAHPPPRFDPGAPGRYGILARWILHSAAALADRVAEAGWTRGATAEAEALAQSIIEVWGPGEHSISRQEVWRERPVGLQVEWLRLPPR